MSKRRRANHGSSANIGPELAFYSSDMNRWSQVQFDVFHKFPPFAAILSATSLATIIANRLTSFFIFASVTTYPAPGGKLLPSLSNCGQPTLKGLQLSI